MASVEESIRRFILDTYLPGEAPENLRPDTRLVSSGILDSFAVLGVTLFLHQQYGAELDVYDTSVERFDRLVDMVDAVRRKGRTVGSGPQPATPR
jgi:acyl carrier protein